jgi:hypothetical protein
MGKNERSERRKKKEERMKQLSPLHKGTRSRQVYA